MVREHLRFVPAERIDTVIETALVKKPVPRISAPALDALGQKQVPDLPANTPIPQ